MSSRRSPSCTRRSTSTDESPESSATESFSRPDTRAYRPFPPAAQPFHGIGRLNRERNGRGDVLVEPTQTHKEVSPLQHRSVPGPSKTLGTHLDPPGFLSLLVCQLSRALSALHNFLPAHAQPHPSSSTRITAQAATLASVSCFRFVLLHPETPAPSSQLSTSFRCFTLQSPRNDLRAFFLHTAAINSLGAG